jgi:hypothetical protein
MTFNSSQTLTDCWTVKEFLGWSLYCGMLFIIGLMQELLVHQLHTLM